MAGTQHCALSRQGEGTTATRVAAQACWHGTSLLPQACACPAPAWLVGAHLAQTLCRGRCIVPVALHRGCSVGARGAQRWHSTAPILRAKRAASRGEPQLLQHAYPKQVESPVLLPARALSAHPHPRQINRALPPTYPRLPPLRPPTHPPHPSHLHGAVAPDHQLPHLATRQRRATAGRRHLRLQVGMDAAHGGNPPVHRVCAGGGVGWVCFCLLLLCCVPAYVLRSAGSCFVTLLPRRFGTLRRCKAPRAHAVAAAGHELQTAGLAQQHSQLHALARPRTRPPTHPRAHTMLPPPLPSTPTPNKDECAPCVLVWKDTGLVSVMPAQRAAPQGLSCLARSGGALCGAEVAVRHVRVRRGGGDGAFFFQQQGGSPEEAQTEAKQRKQERAPAGSQQPADGRQSAAQEERGRQQTQGNKLKTWKQAPSFPPGQPQQTRHTRALEFPEQRSILQRSAAHHNIWLCPPCAYPPEPAASAPPGRWIPP